MGCVGRRPHFVPGYLPRARRTHQGEQALPLGFGSHQFDIGFSLQLVFDKFQNQRVILNGNDSDHDQKRRGIVKMTNQSVKGDSPLCQVTLLGYPAQHSIVVRVWLRF